MLSSISHEIIEICQSKFFLRSTKAACKLKKSSSQTNPLHGYRTCISQRNPHAHLLFVKLFLLANLHPACKTRQLISSFWPKTRSGWRLDWPFRTHSPHPRKLDVILGCCMKADDFFNRRVIAKAFVSSLSKEQRQCNLDHLWPLRSSLSSPSCSFTPNSPSSHVNRKPLILSVGSLAFMHRI